MSAVYRKKSLVRLAVVTSFTIAVAGDVHWAAPASAQQLEPRHFIAHRLDESRVVFVLDGTNVSRRATLREAMVFQSVASLRPTATLSSLGPLWPTDTATLGKHAALIETDSWTTVHAGDEWVLRAGSGLSFDVQIESLAVTEVHCSMRIAVIGRVVDDAVEAFSKVRDKYYLVTPEAETASLKPTPASQIPALLDWTNNQQRPLDPELESAVREQFEKDLVEYQREGGMFARMVKRGVQWASSRREILQRHSPGEGDLISDLQTLRLGPQGEKRLYFRGQLTLEGRSVFHLTCWVTPESNRIERVNFQASTGVVSSWSSGFDNLPMILNVFDKDGDGWGEVLTGVIGYEGFGMELIEYSETGFQETGIEFSGGC